MKRGVVKVLISLVLIFFGMASIAYAMIPPPASHAWLFRLSSLARLTFKGNIYAQTITVVTAPLRTISGGDIISWNNIGQNGEQPIYGKWRIGGYSQANNWDSIKQNVKDTVGRLKKYAKPCSYFNTSLSGTDSPPEGEIYYCDGESQTISGTYSGKGTLIINNANLTISGNIDYSPVDSNASLGVIVLGGNINITKSVNNLNGAYFATGNITFEHGIFDKIDFKGVLAGSTIKLPSRGSFSYDLRLATTPPPGFREIFKALYQEAAP